MTTHVPNEAPNLNVMACLECKANKSSDISLCLIVGISSDGETGNRVGSKVGYWSVLTDICWDMQGV